MVKTEITLSHFLATDTTPHPVTDFDGFKVNDTYRSTMLERMAAAL